MYASGIKAVVTFFSSRISVWREGAQVIPTGTYTKVQFNNEDEDNNCEYDNVTNYRFQPLIAGWYHVTAVIYIGGLIADKTGQCVIYKNGVLFKYGGLVTGFAGSVSCYVSGDVYLLDTDYIEIFANHNNGSDKSIGGSTRGTYMDVHRFG